MSQIEMIKIFEAYYEQCPNERIRYTISSAPREDGFIQSWIVMDEIEMSYMMYQGEPQIIFMCNRYCDKYGDETYFFKTYEDCKRVYNMDEFEITKYADSIQIL